MSAIEFLNSWRLPYVVINAGWRDYRPIITGLLASKASCLYNLLFGFPNKFVKGKYYVTTKYFIVSMERDFKIVYPLQYL